MSCIRVVGLLTAFSLCMISCALDLGDDEYTEVDNQAYSPAIAQDAVAKTDSETDFVADSSGLRAQRQQKAFYYFTSKCLNSIQSAAIVGNLIQESHLDPTADQSDGRGMGIAQWSEGGRWDNPAYHLDNMTWFAKLRHASRWEFDAQLDFIWYELDNFDYYGLRELQAADSITQAVTRFGNLFEKCEKGLCNFPQRVRYANYILDRYAPRRSDGRPSYCDDRGTQSDAQSDNSSDNNINTCPHGSHCWCQKDQNCQFAACDGYQNIEGTRSFCRTYPQNSKCDNYGGIEGTRGFCRAYPQNSKCDDYGGIEGTRGFCRAYPKNSKCDSYGNIPGTRAFCRSFPKSKYC